MDYNDGYDYKNHLRILLRHFEDDKFARNQIIKAYAFARLAHKNQKRKSGEAYDIHPIEVSMILEQMGADYETICAALLHDTIEDVEWVTKEKIESKFGKIIADLVDGVTKFSTSSDKDKRIRDIKTINKLILSLDKDARIIIIKLADRLHNMITINGHKSEEKRINIAQQTVDVYIPIARLLGLYNLKERLESKCFPILYPDEYEKIKKLKKEQIEDNKDLSKIIFDLKFMGSDISLYKLLKNNGIEVDDVEFKFKENFSIYRKLKKLGTDNLSKIDDLLTYNIKTKNVADVYRVMGVINSVYPVINEKEYAMKDYVSNPKYNYYRALHTYNIVRYNGQSYQVHFQIQTTDMWRESIDGIANFWNHDKDETAKNKMQYSLENDFPFYNDLARLSRNYEKGEYSDNTFYEKVKKLILPRRINIKMVGYNHKQTYDGCTIKDLIISIHPNIIRSDVDYYINGELKDINYQLKDGDFFEEKIREIKDSEFVRKRK